MSRVIAIIQARLGSTRFPNKVLAELLGKPVIRHVVERALMIRGVDRVVVACPMCDADPLAEALGSGWWEGWSLHYPPVPDNDVLGRYYHTATKLGATDVMRLTADCPLLCPDLAEQVLALYRFDGAYARVPQDWYYDGLDVEVFSMAELERAQERDADHNDREHVTRGVLRALACPAVDVGFRRKFSIDTTVDLRRVEAVMRAMDGNTSYAAFVRAQDAGWQW